MKKNILFEISFDSKSFCVFYFGKRERHVVSVAKVCTLYWGTMLGNSHWEFVEKVGKDGDILTHKLYMYVVVICVYILVLSIWQL